VIAQLSCYNFLDEQQTLFAAFAAGETVCQFIDDSCCGHIVYLFCHLCNLSMSSGIFPTQLKQARVLPLLKKQPIPYDPSPTYCTFQISSNVLLPPAFLYIHLNLISYLSAYRPFHSTETALLSVHNDLVRSTDNRKSYTRFRLVPKSSTVDDPERP